MPTHPATPLNADRPPGDPDCERCEGTGLDPDAYFVDEERQVWTHAPCSECLPEEDELEPAEYPEDAPCTATFREEPMPYTVHCQESGHHGRHTSGGGSEYYTWLDGDEGAGWEQ